MKKDIFVMEMDTYNFIFVWIVIFLKFFPSLLGTLVIDLKMLDELSVKERLRLNVIIVLIWYFIKLV